MQVFINECSLHSQFYTKDEFTYAVRVFISLFSFLRKNKIDGNIYKVDDLFVNYKALREEFFIKSLNSISDKTLKVGTKNILLNKHKIIDWNKERLHSPEESFEYDNEDVTDTSMAELAERKSRKKELTGVLVNFLRSKFENLEIAQIIKNREHTINLECVEDERTLEKWLEKHSLLNLYKPTSKEPPNDRQTVLRDLQRFHATSFPFQAGRKVYQEIKTGYYWYVDSLHFGRAAHLEIFNKKKEHLGTADLDGKIDFSRAEKSKKLKI